MVFLYWNMNRKPLIEEVVALAHEHDVDVLVLSESEVPRPSLLLRLNSGFDRKYAVPRSIMEEPLILLRLGGADLELVRDDPGLAFRRLVLPSGPDILLVAAHLPSKLHQTEHDQALMATRIARDIVAEEKGLGHSRTVLFGDLNMDPFEYGVVGAEGLHAVMSRRVAARGTRVVAGQERCFFYNPMWGHYGDRHPGPPGTYYYASSRQVCHFWHMFDQVMIRPALLECFDHESVRILDRIAEARLLNAAGVPDAGVYSDHLPVLFSLNLSEGAL